MQSKWQGTTAAIILGLIGCIWGCQSTYYSVWEKMGKEKRHLLKDQVEEAQEDQHEATAEFKDALTRVKEIYGFDGGDLEDFYTKLKRDYNRCERRAEVITRRIDRVEQIAADLFAEWETEIGEINNAQFRSKSRRSLSQTRQRYNRMHTAMTRARSKMDPVLAHLKDYVLYLKHNLNAQAIGALGQEVTQIDIEIKNLVVAIETSIQEAESFIQTMEKT